MILDFRQIRKSKGDYYMDMNALHSFLTIGETVAVEFKRCGNGIESDVYESVCSFLNRFGGDLFMGVLDDGTVLGIRLSMFMFHRVQKSIVIRE
jgi:predicted HTH transcriptional regulator